MLFLIAGMVAIVLGGVALGYLASQEFRPDRVPILLYHRLRSRTEAADLDWERIFVVYADEFERQMEYLHQHGYRVIDLEDYLLFVRGERKLPKNPVIITFDDGYDSVYRHAWPILKRLNFPAVVFVTVNEESEVFKPFRPYDSPLNREQIKAMSEGGISIQSHGLTHRALCLLSPEEVRKELIESRRQLEGITGKPVKFLAIPGAFYSPEVKRLARETGYEAAFSGHKGSNNKNSDLFSLRRVVPERDFNLNDFARSLGPLAACEWRVVGWLKSLPTVFIGPEKGKKLRAFLYRTRFGGLLSYKNFSRLLIGAMAIIVLIVIWLIARTLI